MFTKNKQKTLEARPLLHTVKVPSHLAPPCHSDAGVLRISNKPSRVIVIIGLERSEKNVSLAPSSRVKRRSRTREPRRRRVRKQHARTVVRRATGARVPHSADRPCDNDGNYCPERFTTVGRHVQRVARAAGSDVTTGVRLPFVLLLSLLLSSLSYGSRPPAGARSNRRPRRLVWNGESRFESVSMRCVVNTLSAITTTTTKRVAGLIRLTSHAFQ